jgi:L-threonylcarbamoyladenylate synthase
MNVYDSAVCIINNGGLAVIPTDTIYGIVASAFDKKAITKLHKLKQRPSGKPFIVLVSDVSQLNTFGIDTKWQKSTFKYWPGPYSLIFPCNNPSLKYLTSKDKTIALRMPDNKELVEFIKQTGPIVAPSANPGSLPPAKNITKAREYFGDNVDIYIDGGEITNINPSTLIDIKSGKILR